MNTKSLTVVVLFKAGPGNESKVRQALTALLAATRKEEGCLNYDLHLSEADSSLFMFHENWASKEHLERHLQTDHVQKALEVVEPLLADPAQITLWQKIG